jgi:ATP diphosphatase
MSAAFDQLLAIMARLRDPARGCPWDIEQDFDTIAPYTVEEAHEVADAIARRDYRNLQEELGDLLLQVVFHAQMAKDQGLFAFEAVAEGINAKLIRRHPHVFPGGRLDGETDAIPVAQVSDNWEAIKAAEKAARGEMAEHLLDSVSAGMPAMARAEKLQKKASKVGFDWHDPKAVLAKLREEIDEVEEAIDRQHARAALEDELGDILFCVVNLARHLELDAEQALKRSNAKFIRRFNHIEDTLKGRGQALAEATLEEMEALWVQAKAGEPPLA